jgi:alanyl-tRNA synthetase
MRTAEIIERFLGHFIKNGHELTPSASLILDDPNLLFVNAGMVQFVPYFLGQRTPPSPRMTSIQKCVRTQDIDEVGVTTRHNTFFQMAGNFSFGDYFKEGAIRFAWTLLTSSVSDGGYGFDPDRLWATVFEDDNEAIELWKKVAGLPDERIQRRGPADNYWSMGIPGPSGPCSEIYYDRGPQYGADGGPEADEDRYLEIWNLVFMQNELAEFRSKTDFDIAGPLPKRNIDTGMGVERIAFLLQEVDNVYETDVVRPVISVAEQLTGRRYGAGSHADDTRFRVIADHARTAVMLIGDGVNPGNDGRGYVLRRLLRRIVRAARLLGATELVTPALVGQVVSSMSPMYPELSHEAARIERIAAGEEHAFRNTIDSGSKLFEQVAAGAMGSSRKIIPGAEAFALHDTYGFPLELTLEMAREVGLEVDQEGFAQLMAEQRSRAKADAKSRKQAHEDQSVYQGLLDGPPTEFTGFDELSSFGTILGIVLEGQLANEVRAGQEAQIILDRTPLYAESGGQLADTGSISAPGASAEVADVQKIAKRLFAHRVKVVEGVFATGQEVTAQVDSKWRHGANQGHSGTHLVHAALRQILGPEATQAGSLNKPGYLRFDFRWHSALSSQTKQEIESVVGEAVETDYPVNTFVTDIDRARAMGALALFGENYGERVRVVEIGGPFSMELCGGTHVPSSAKVGPVVLLGESSTGSGTRRVEALVGYDAREHLAKERALVAAVASAVGAPTTEAPDKVRALVERVKTLEREIARQAQAQARAQAVSLAQSASPVRLSSGAAVEFVSAEVDSDDLRGLAASLKEAFGSRAAVAALFHKGGGKVAFAVLATKAANELGAKAGELLRAVAPVVNGRGGGKDDLAQGSGTDPSAVPAAQAKLREEIAGLTARV